MTQDEWNSIPEYNAWKAMKQRCYNQNSPSYQYYGERGITVCREWRDSYTAFLNYIGPRPGPEYSLDRIDNDGNYEPGNVRWATRSQQERNRPVGDKRHNLKLDWDIVREIRATHGNQVSLRDLAWRFGVSIACIHDIVRHRTWKEECVS